MKQYDSRGGERPHQEVVLAPGQAIRSFVNGSGHCDRGKGEV